MGLTRKRQVGALIESTEGAINTPTLAADFSNLIYEPTVEDDYRMFERDPARADLSNLEAIVGIRMRQFRVRTEIRGSGAVGTAPKWGVLLRGCGMRQETLQTVSIGAITTGPFQQGEVVTGGTSTATGIVHQKTTTGAPTIQIVRTSVATFASGEVITGATSGATATTSSAEATYGFRYRPWSTDPDTATANGNVLGPGSISFAIMEDGIQKLIRGARGIVSVACTVGEPAFFEFEFQGAEAGTADLALITGIIHDTTSPPKFQGANINSIALVDGSSPFNSVVTMLNFSMGNELAPRENANDAEGVTSVKIPKRKVTGTFNPEMTPVATYDWYGKWRNAAIHRMDTTLGVNAGNIVDLRFERIQLLGVKEANRNGIDTVDVDFGLLKSGVNSTGDDECFLVVH